MIDKINPNLTNGSRLSSQNLNRRGYCSPNFTGVSPSEVKGQINKLQNPFMKWMNKFENNIGELQDVCINAVGTGLLAPIFIKYNPLSKTDEDTRTYSAWRQPISAVLAVCTSGLITIPFSRLVKRMSNDGTFSEPLNKTPFMDKDFLTKQTKKNHPDWTKARIEAHVKDTMKAQEAALLNTIKEQNTVNYTLRDIVSGKISTKSMSKDKFTDLLLKTVADLKENEQKQLDRFNKEKIPNRIARDEYFRTHPEASENLLTSINTKINETNNIDDIKKFLQDKKKTVKSDKELKQILTDLINYADVDKKSVQDKVTHMLEYLEQSKGKNSKTEIEAMVKAGTAPRVEQYKTSITFLTEIEKAINEGKTVKEIERLFDEKKGIKDLLSESLQNKNFADEVVKKLKDLTKSRIDGCKRIANLIVALAVLPVACSLLNWIYPRFMAAVFPNLSNKKHGNESKELVDKATKNQEVK